MVWCHVMSNSPSSQCRLPQGCSPLPPRGPVVVVVVVVAAAAAAAVVVVVVVVAVVVVGLFDTAPKGRLIQLAGGELW